MQRLTKWRSCPAGGKGCYVKANEFITDYAVMQKLGYCEDECKPSEIEKLKADLAKQENNFHTALNNLIALYSDERLKYLETIIALKSDNEAKDKRIEVLEETLKIAIKNWSYYSMDDLIKLAEEALKERK